MVRDARLTDVARITSLLAAANRSVDAGSETSSVADLLRQLVYLPSASVFVALQGRELVGASVLSLRPSVRAGGLVGTVDLLTVDPGTALDGVADALLAETLRSARNKGCVEVEVVQEDGQPDDLWTRTGFTETRRRLFLGPSAHRSPA